MKRHFFLFAVITALALGAALSTPTWAQNAPAGVPPASASATASIAAPAAMDAAPVAVASKAGAPRTMFKPDEGMAYWEEQKAREARRQTARRSRAADDDA